MYVPTSNVAPISPANRLGLVYRAEASRLPWPGPIHDVHVHITTLAAARVFFDVADLFHVQRIWCMAPLEQVDVLREHFGPRIEFIAVPNYAARGNPQTFTSDWLRRIEGFAEKGCRIVKFWAAPRGRDWDASLTLDSLVRLEAMRLAHQLGMKFMTHVADPDTWFATHYRDHQRYGYKHEHYVPLERLLDEFHDVPWLAAHMAGDPEHLDHLQQLLDRHPNLYLDTSATKWMVRELSKHPAGHLSDFLHRNAGRVLFGSDIVASEDGPSAFDLYASRYWALRTLWETDYDGSSPIVDPDLPLLDASLSPTATAHLRGCRLDPAILPVLYHDAAQKFLSA